MVQHATVFVRHAAADCPADKREALEPLLRKLGELESQVGEHSDFAVKITAQRYRRNKHEFEYDVEITDATLEDAEDAIKKSLGIRCTISSEPFETLERAGAKLQDKLSHL